MGRRTIERPSSVMKSRPGENTVPVFKQVAPNPDGTSQTTISINFNDVPIPERRYVAELGGIVFDGTIVKILFGQKRVVGDTLRSLIVIVFSPDALRRFLEMCTNFLPELHEIASKNNLTIFPLTSINDEPTQTVAMASNLIAAARAGREATFDFYHCSAASLHESQSKNSDRLAVEPVVRVDLPLNLMIAIIDELVSLSDKFPAEFK
jgi:hypothetical protein